MKIEQPLITKSKRDQLLADTSLNSFPKRLSRFIEIAEVKRTDLAELLSVSTVTISNWINDKTGIAIAQLKLLCDLSGISPSWWISGAISLEEGLSSLDGLSWIAELNSTNIMPFPFNNPPEAFKKGSAIRLCHSTRDNEYYVVDTSHTHIDFNDADSITKSIYCIEITNDDSHSTVGVFSVEVDDDGIDQLVLTRWPHGDSIIVKSFNFVAGKVRVIGLALWAGLMLSE